MAIEIERKFLVASNAWQCEADVGRRMRQAYLSSTKQNSVRVRIVDDARAWLAIKSAFRGLTRDEFEYEIPLADALQMLDLRCSGIVDKVRYKVEAGHVVWEIDEYFGENAGLIIAEVELTDEAQELVLPAWVGREVTGDQRFQNSGLADRPLAAWPAEERRDCNLQLAGLE